MAGSSSSQVLSSVAYNAVIFGIFMSIFFIFRLKLKRLYEPKSTYDLVDEEQKPDPLPKGLWQWLMPLLKKSDNFIIRQTGIDGYFFLRYLFLMSIYCAISAVWLYPILLPVNVVHGRNQDGMDKLAFQNVKNQKRYYAHIFCGWIFYWMFLFVIYRELYYYNSVRCVVLSSPRYGRKLSSRTVLFQSVPNQYLSEREFRKLFEGVRRIWIARGDHYKLEEKIGTRDALVDKLERTAVKYQLKALKKVRKTLKKTPDHEVVTDINSYIPKEKRPRHRPRFWKKKVDTINYICQVLPKLNADITYLQKHNNDASPFNSAFVEFESQYQAQVAAQVVSHHGPLALSPAHVGVEPGDVYWPNMRIFWWERMVRSMSSIAAVCALVLLWSIPVAFVGMISNVDYLTNKVHWLRFIYNLPRPLLGLLTALFPTVALAWLMSFLPTFIMMLAKFAGAGTSQLLDSFAQQTFFAFQVVQVFLVVTITSAATSTVTRIVEYPENTMYLLAGNLPKSSNFFISYLLLQGMGVSSAILAQILPLIFFYIIGPFTDTTPRKKYLRFKDLGAPGWGFTYPVYCNLAVITFAYAIIAPLILIFAAVGFFLLYIAWLYTLTYVQAQGSDSRGQNYPRALFHTIVGLYLGQVCLLGLFAVGKGWGPIVLQAIGLAVTVIVHIHLNKAFDRLMKYIPVDTMKSLNGKHDTPSFKNIYHEQVDWSDELEELPPFPLPKYQPKSASSGINDNDNSVTSPSHANSPTTPYTTDTSAETTYAESMVHYNPLPSETYEMSENKVSWVPLLADGVEGRIRPAPFYIRFFLPHIYASFKAVKYKLPECYGLLKPETPESDAANASAYNYPAVSSQCPSVWLPRDPFGFSEQLIEELEGVVIVSDENAVVDPDGHFHWLGDPPAPGLPEPPHNKTDENESTLRDNEFTENSSMK